MLARVDDQDRVNVHSRAWSDSRLSVIHLRILMLLSSAALGAWRDLFSGPVRIRIIGTGNDYDERWVDISARQLVDWGYIERSAMSPGLCRIRLADLHPTPAGSETR